MDVVVFDVSNGMFKYRIEKIHLLHFDAIKSWLTTN